MVTVVTVLWGKRLFDEPELIVIKVIVSLVYNVQLLLTPPTKQETEGLNDGAFIKF